MEIENTFLFKVEERQPIIEAPRERNLHHRDMIFPGKINYYVLAFNYKLRQ